MKNVNLKVIDKIAEAENKQRESAQAALNAMLADNPELKQKMEKDGVSTNIADWKKLDSWDGSEKN